MNLKKNMLDSIPVELIMEIVVRVAAYSCKDLFNTKLSCKSLNKIADDEYIFRHVSLREFPLRWLKQESYLRFLDHCVNSGNLEAIYRSGIEHYFEKENREFGIKFFSRAANLGYPEAKYMIGIVLILLGGEDGGKTKPKGTKIIGDLKKSKITRHRIKEIREKFVSVLDSYFRWSNKSMVIHARPTCCTRHKHAKLWIDRGWDGFEDVYSECEACCSDQELIYLWDLTHNYAQHLVG